MRLKEEVFLTLFLSKYEQETIKRMEEIAEDCCSILNSTEMGCVNCPFQYFCNEDGSRFDLKYGLKYALKNIKVTYED